jgi:hypothetical protein
MPSDVERLRTVQAKVRQLADSTPTARELLVHGFLEFTFAVDRFNTQRERVCRMVLDAARELLRSGRLLGDAPSAGTVRPVEVNVRGQYPHALVAEMEAAGNQENWPADLSRRVAEATLTVLDSGPSVRYEANERNPNGWYVTVCDRRNDPALLPFCLNPMRVPRPEGVEAVYNPWSVAFETLVRIEERQPDTWRAIVCYRLGGLADAGRRKKLVPAPSDGEAQESWRARFPVIDWWYPDSGLNPQRLPPDLAEEMLAFFERWVAEASPSPIGDTKAPALPAGADAIERAAERAAEKFARANGGNGHAARRGDAGTTRCIYLWPGAAPTKHNVRLARTRDAYLKHRGNVAKALAALEAEGNPIAQSTFYNHLKELDKAIPGWRDSVR